MIRVINMTDFEHFECLSETLRELQEDAQLLRLALLASRPTADGLTLDCLLRLSDYLSQHVNDICVLCRKYHRDLC